ncbi:MAG: lipid-A-disaccharide synthase [Desulfatiglans sp.]|nr:lipid-A-disaccharide synthase [Desulfatiglans sp.]
MREATSISSPSPDSKDSKFVAMVAGEASGDLHGANLVKAIRHLRPDISFAGIGGKKMEAAGVKIFVPSSDMAVVGLSEVFSRFHTITRALSRLKTTLKKQRPDLLILIDYPDFNLHLARKAKRLHIPVLYYISPQVWAWREGRVRKIRRRVDRMAVILPFEEAFYRERGMAVDYVGHPLLDACPKEFDKKDIKSKLGLEGAYPVVGIVPGSRKEEVQNVLPVMVRAAEILKERFPNIRCLLPLAETIEEEWVRSFLRNSTVKVEIQKENIYEVLGVCDLVLITSGTATLEAAIMGVPMVISYRVSPLSYWIGKRIIKVPHIGLVNLVAQDDVVPELIQDEMTFERLAEEASSILKDDRKRTRMIAAMKKVRESLGTGGASVRAARIALQMMR